MFSRFISALNTLKILYSTFTMEDISSKLANYPSKLYRLKWIIPTAHEAFIVQTNDSSSVTGRKMVTNVSIKGFEEFVKYTDSIDPKGPPVYFYFDSKLPDGTSWCPDCVVAEPIVRGFLRDVKKELIFVHVDCGARDFYRDPQCVFRTDSRSKIRRIPTLFKWRGDRLEETELNDPENLRKLFEV